MDIQTLTRFFMWCTIINGGLLLLWASLCLLAPDFVYHSQTRWFPLSRETFTVLLYTSLGLFKMFFIFFNVVPYIVLLIIG